MTHRRQCALCTGTWPHNCEEQVLELEALLERHRRKQLYPEGAYTMPHKRKDGIEELKTFDEWAALGYRVRKGEKSVARRDSNHAPLFSTSQVWDPNAESGEDAQDDRDAFDVFSGGRVPGSEG